MTHAHQALTRALSTPWRAKTPLTRPVVHPGSVRSFCTRTRILPGKAWTMSKTSSLAGSVQTGPGASAAWISAAVPTRVSAAGCRSYLNIASTSPEIDAVVGLRAVEMPVPGGNPVGLHVELPVGIERPVEQHQWCYPLPHSSRFNRLINGGAKKCDRQQLPQI